MPDDPTRLVFKTPVTKRKKVSHSQYQTRNIKKAVGAAGQLDDAAATENDSSDSNISSCSQTCGSRKIYTLKMIRDFLESTKHAKGVRVEDHFPDRIGFVQSVQYLQNNSGEEGFTDQEIFRLKKIVTKLNHQLMTAVRWREHPLRFLWCGVLAVLSLYSLFNMDKFKVATLNVNGARDANKRAQLFELHKHIDVMFVQETHSDERNAVDWVREYDGRAFLSHRSSVSGGVALLFAKSWAPQSVEVENIMAGNQGDIEALKTKKVALADLLGVKAQGALVRSLFQKVAQMDAPSKFFFSLECKNGQRRCIRALWSESGALLSDPAGILSHAAKFYGELYTSEYSEQPELEKGFFVGLPKLVEDSALGLERQLSLAELSDALQSMECGKALGTDGL
ncbi:hypothetical protein SRHO_G00302100 [Serrasalmus rhombeus]